MKYACLIYLNDLHHLDGFTEPQRAAFINEVLDNDEALRQSGNWLDAHALDLPTQAATVRVRQGKLATTDGPFVETKEHLAGIVIIEARDLNDAIRIAGTIPMARTGAIEVRPVKFVERQDAAA
ncbi:MAG TPA: YciI family protein [Rhizobiaceae bacterium]|nr:YciI family protein [Rhizobiaceae bacterium]